MLTIEEKDRISWEELFNHRLFKDSFDFDNDDNAFENKE